MRAHVGGLDERLALTRGTESAHRWVLDRLVIDTLEALPANFGSFSTGRDESL